MLEDLVEVLDKNAVLRWSKSDSGLYVWMFTEPNDGEGDNHVYLDYIYNERGFDEVKMQLHVGEGPTDLTGRRQI